jgi:putative flippase GtrA
MTEPAPVESSRDGSLSFGWHLPLTLRALGRHQLGALVGTGVDFGAMIACVEGLGLAPAGAAAIGSALGAVTNFTVGRTWVFRRRSESASGQAFRYALVSAASAGWNSFGEHLVHDLAHVRYVLARAFVALAVGVLWNFPMHRHFVFR